MTRRYQPTVFETTTLHSKHPEANEHLQALLGFNVLQTPAVGGIRIQITHCFNSSRCIDTQMILISRLLRLQQLIKDQDASDLSPALASGIGDALDTPTELTLLQQTQLMLAQAAFHHHGKDRSRNEAMQHQAIAAAKFAQSKLNALETKATEPALTLDRIKDAFEDHPLGYPLDILSPASNDETKLACR